MDWISIFSKNQLMQNGLSTGLLFFALLVIRFLAIRQIANSQTIPKEFRRQWIVKVKGFCLFLFTVGVVVIWASELRTFALSMVAIAAAVVLGLKEILMSMSGSFVRASSDMFSVGDRIEVNGVRGDVIDHSLFVTTLLEIGPGHTSNQYTGRAVAVPNSLFLSHHVFNESFTEKFVLHVFEVPVQISEHVEDIRRAFLLEAQKACASYLEEAREYFARFGKKLGIESPDVDPRVVLNCGKLGVVNLVIRYPTTEEQRIKTEQEILSRVIHDKARLFVPTVEPIEHDYGS